MSWDRGYTSPEDQAIADRERAEAQQRARMTPFERRQLDYLGEISASLASIARALNPVVDAEVIEDEGLPITLTAAGDGGGVSADPSRLGAPQPAVTADAGLRWRRAGVETTEEQSECQTPILPIDQPASATSARTSP